MRPIVKPCQGLDGVSAWEQNDLQVGSMRAAVVDPHIVNYGPCIDGLPLENGHVH